MPTSAVVVLVVAIAFDPPAAVASVVVAVVVIKDMCVCLPLSSMDNENECERGKKNREEKWKYVACIRLARMPIVFDKKKLVCVWIFLKLIFV